MCDQEGLDREFSQRLSELEWNICYMPATQKAVFQAWIAKLKTSNSSLDESRYRNDILFYLIDRTSCSSNMVIPEPFDIIPKDVPLTDASWKYPRNMRERCPKVDDRNNLLEMFRASPDRGAFLAEQPVPRVGTFGFMVFKKPTKDV